MNKPLNIPFGLKPISAEMLVSFQQLDNNQLQWLSGYCAGLVESRSADSSNVVNNSKLKTQILYGSQTGNSESLARQLQSQFSELNLDLSFDSLDNLKAKDLEKYDVNILVISTHGEGEPPDDSLEFYESLMGKRAPNLTGKKHAVLALGDSSYEFFCQTGKELDERLVALESTALIDRLDADVDYEDETNQWMDSLFSIINELSNSPKNAASTDPKENYLATRIAENRYTKATPLTASVLSNQPLTGKGSSKNVNHLELSLNGKNFHYLPGDGIGIWAPNNHNLVDNILAVTGLKSDEIVKVKEAELSLSKALTEKMEITLISNSLIQSISSLIDDTGATVSDFTSVTEQDNFIKSNQLFDLLLLTQQKIKFEAQQLVDLLKPIKPRVYSIASSLSANPDEVHITVGLQENTNDRGVRKGVASQYLIESLKENDDVFIYLESNKRFRLPENDKPIILVGPGTGIAPFRSFLQQREEERATGKNWLFFGNPHFNTDFLYQIELQKLSKNKGLSRLDVAFSRDQEEKIYVQDKLEKKALEIWQWLDSKGAYFYLCGDMHKMAKDVEKTLLTIIMEQGNRTKAQAKDYLKQLKKENRYQRDVY